MTALTRIALLSPTRGMGLYLAAIMLLTGCAAPNGTSEIAAEPDVIVTLSAQGREFYRNGEPNPDIVVSRGDTVRVDLAVTAGRHNWSLDHYDVSTATVASGTMASVTFVADQAGEFEYYCGVTWHREEGMVGTFIVE